jgi:hypothetical protein
VELLSAVELHYPNVAKLDWLSAILEDESSKTNDDGSQVGDGGKMRCRMAISRNRGVMVC